MQKLQACPKCGAQFDVSAFASGQKFTCGACGTVVTAGASAPAVGRVPGTPRGSSGSASAPAPSRSAPPAAPPGAAFRGAPNVPPRGPQYKPLERHQQPGASPAAVPPPSSRSRERPSREPGQRKKASPAMLLGVLGGLAAVIVGAVVLMSGKSDKGNPVPVSGGGTNVAGGANKTSGSGTSGAGQADPSTSLGTVMNDTVASLDAEFKGKSGLATAKKRDYMGRYKAIGTPEAMERAKGIARDVAQTALPSDPAVKEAHLLLGHIEFNHTIPESISFLKYPFIRAVTDANAQRWFEDREQVALAEKEWEKTKAHGEKILSDRVYRALDGARANVDRDEFFKGYNYETYFANPYLIFYSSNERMDDADLFKMPKEERKKTLADLDAKKKTWARILKEKGMIFQQLYAEFMKRYAESCDLKDLMAEFGGRPDYGVGKRSMGEGCPMIVWIFSDRKAFDEYHVKVKKEGIDEGIAGYFSPVSGWVYLYDEGRDDRSFEVNKNVHEGTHQLVHWFTAQKNEWQTQLKVPQSWFGEGFAEYIGAVKMDRERKLSFLGLNAPRLGGNIGMNRAYKAQAGKDLPVMPLQDLVGFEGYGSVEQYCAEKYKMDRGQALQLFYCQSWALVYFLNESLGHKYQKQFNKYLEEVLNGHHKISAFKKAFAMKSDEDWSGLQKEFNDAFKKLMSMDVSTIGAAPPARDDWPSYVPDEGETGSKDSGGGK